MLQGCYGCQKKQKTPTKLDILVWCANFHPNLKKLSKTVKKWALFHCFLSFFKIFKFWLESSAQYQLVLIPWWFRLHLIPICSLCLYNQSLNRNFKRNPSVQREHVGTFYCIKNIEALSLQLKIAAIFTNLNF